MSINTQQLIGAHVLSNIRALERAFGVDTIRSLDLSKRGFIVRPGYPQGTPAKRHKITDRHARKVKARELCIGRVLHGIGWYPQAAEV